jgi:hypothetical protein
MSFDKEAARIAKAMGWSRPPTLNIKNMGDYGTHLGRAYRNRWHITLKPYKNWNPISGVVLLIHECAHLQGPRWGEKDHKNRTVHGVGFLHQMKEIAFKTYGVDVSWVEDDSYRAVQNRIAKALRASKWAAKWGKVDTPK